MILSRSSVMIASSPNFVGRLTRGETRYSKAEKARL